MQMARREGIRVGLIRPIVLWPFPAEPIREAAGRVGAFLVVELSLGQMIEDVRLCVEGAVPVHFYGRVGGMVPTPQEILEKLREVSAGLGKRRMPASAARA
jgi:2-oxoglutarate ferredoxin oxidoreductase subunit alpha